MAWKVVQRWAEAHTFSSARLRYRPPRKGDAAELVSNFDDEARAWHGWVDAPWSVRAADRQFAAPALRDCAPHLLVCTPDGAIVGDYSFQPGSTTTEVVLGWTLGPAGRGRGFGAESLPAVLAYVHRHVGAPRVRMGTDLRNVRALRQITGAGAHLVEESDHELPNGSVVRSRWFVHDDPEVARYRATHDRWVPACRR